MLKKLFLSIITMISFGCSSDDSVTPTNPQNDVPTNPSDKLYFPPIDNNMNWETTSPTALGWNTTAETPLYDFLEEKNTKAFMILKDGKIVIEKYFNGATALDNNPWYSAGKTLTAFTAGIAQQEGQLDINKLSSDYLGSGWATITTAQEAKITVKHHLTMTTGLDYTVINNNCTDPDCLLYLNEAGSFWYYHNATYTLLSSIISSATQQDYRIYFASRIKNKIGMDGAWISLGFLNIYHSTARSMARFGLLNLNKGTWDNTPILTDQDYFENMTSSSQNLNPSYGYLWWLNGKNSLRAPGSEEQFPIELIPNAPDDLIAGLGKNDQKLYLIPSQNLVIVRMGDDASGAALLGPSGFDNQLWEKINDLIN